MKKTVRLRPSTLARTSRHLVGHIHEYLITVSDDVITVRDANTVVTQQYVEGISAFVLNAGNLRLGLAAFPDFEVIYLYDKAEGNYGYAVNLQDAALSEWGCAPFRT